MVNLLTLYYISLDLPGLYYSGFMEDTIHNEDFDALYANTKQLIAQHGFTIEEENTTKPWGAYIRLSNDDAERFAATYFEEHEFDTYKNLSPKFLLVAPHKRLSWQKHARRAELWTVLKGPVGAKISESDKEPDEITTLQEGEYIEFDTEVRHRLVGLNDWGIVTEIWKHTKMPDLSNEDDIIRIQDDFAR